MEKIYIFGHQKPDTDSVCASISLSYLKNQLGYNTIPKVLGHVNKESKFVLDYFNLKEPEFLNDVKVQVKNMNINKNAIINERESIKEAFLLMQNDEQTGICVVDDDKKFKGLFTLKELAKQLIAGDKGTLTTNLDNVIKILNAKVILEFDKEIKGKIIAASYNSKTIVENIDLSENDILIVGDRYKILEYAINSKVKLIILTGNHELPKELLIEAKNNKINVISTELDTYNTSNELVLSNYISEFLTDTNPIKVDINDYRTDFLVLSEKLGHSNYPIVNKKNKCLGLLTTNNINNYEKLHIILVDHNGFNQSVEGIEEAIIDEIIDHHNLLNIGTSIPINFRSMPVGSTCTIIYHMYIENNIKIPKDMAGVMLSAILSDTLLLKSVTTTKDDIEVANILANIAKVDIKTYGHDMIKAGFSIKDRDLGDLLEEDIKTFRVKEKFVGVSQIFTMDYDDIKENITDFISDINNLASTKFDMVITLITDIEKNGSYVFYDEKSESLVKDIFDDLDFYEGKYIQNLLSRKKQLVPNVMEVLEK